MIESQEILIHCPKDITDIFTSTDPKFSAFVGRKPLSLSCVSRGQHKEDVEKLLTSTTLSTRGLSTRSRRKKKEMIEADDYTACSPTLSTTTGCGTAGGLPRTSSSARSNIGSFGSMPFSSGHLLKSPPSHHISTPIELSFCTEELPSLRARTMASQICSTSSSEGSLGYLPSRRLIPQTVVPKLDLQKIAYNRKTRKCPLLAMDVANLLTNNTFSVGDAARAVQFQTLRPGSNAPGKFAANATGRGKKLAQGSERPPKPRISFTGPGFAPLPQSKHSTSSGSESVPIFRRPTLSIPDATPAESPRSVKARDHSVLFDEKYFPGMFKSKREVRRRVIAETCKASKVAPAEQKEELDPKAKVNLYMQRFRKVYDVNNVNGLIDLLNCQVRLPADSGVVRQIHPWVSPPESFSALAANQLVIILNQQGLNPKQADRCIDECVRLLATPFADCYEASLLLLSFVTLDCPDRAQFMYERNSLPHLIHLMHKEKEGVKAVAAQLCRNIYVLDLKFRRAFRDLGGIHALLSLLDGNATAELKLEAIFHVEDLIMQNGEEIPEFMECVKVLSLGTKLEKILEAPVRGADAKVLTSGRDLIGRRATTLFAHRGLEIGARCEMGNLQCCGERPEHRAKTYLQNLPSQQHAEEPAVNVADLVAFDRAFKSNNVEGLIKLLRSTTPFNVDDSLGEAMGHPWADPPTCVAALAATQLAALASTDEVSLKKDIIDHGGIQEFYRLIQPGVSRDQKEAALVALTFMSLSDANDNRGVDILVSLNAFPRLIKIVSGTSADNNPASRTSGKNKREKLQARLAAAQICRNMFVSSLERKVEFYKSQGVDALVRLLQDISDDSDASLECLYILEDWISNPSNPEIRSYLANIGGLKETLLNLAQSHDEEISQSGTNIIQALYA